MPPAARKTDLTVHGGAIMEGSPNVTIGFLPAARLLDKHVCPLHGPGPITQSSLTVFINGVGAARMGDACTCMIPSTGAGGGSGPDKGEPTKFGIGREKKFGEETKEWEKEEKGPWKEKPAEPPTPKITAELSREFGKAGNADEKKGAFETGIWESKGAVRAGVEADLTNLRNAKAEAGAKYEIEGTAARAQGQLGDVSQGSFAQAKGEARFLTAKAGAQGGIVAEVKDGKLEQAYVGGEAGIGGSVVEGKVEGQTRAFKLPFINWGISFNGEASGALLTAEAKASAMAGYKDGKWTFGFGAKLGAAIAGLGFKFGFSIEKLDPPKPPPKPPACPASRASTRSRRAVSRSSSAASRPPTSPDPPARRTTAARWWATRRTGTRRARSPLQPIRSKSVDCRTKSWRCRSCRTA